MDDKLIKELHAGLQHKLLEQIQQAMEEVAKKHGFENALAVHAHPRYDFTIQEVKDGYQVRLVEIVGFVDIIPFNVNKVC